MPLWSLAVFGLSNAFLGHSPHARSIEVKEVRSVNDRCRINERASIALEWKLSVTWPDHVSNHGDFDTFARYETEYEDWVTQLDDRGNPSSVVRVYRKADRGGSAPALAYRRGFQWPLPAVSLPRNTVVSLERGPDGSTRAIGSQLSQSDLELLSSALIPSDVRFFPGTSIKLGEKWGLTWSATEQPFGLSGTATIDAYLSELTERTAKASATGLLKARLPEELPLDVTIAFEGAGRTELKLHRPLGHYIRGTILISGRGTKELERIGNVSYDISASGTVVFRRSWKWLRTGSVKVVYDIPIQTRR